MYEVNVQVSGSTYSIRIQAGLFGTLPPLIRDAFPGKKLALVCETRVRALMGDRLLTALQEAGCDAFLIPFEEGEAHKTLATLTDLYAALAAHRFTRSDVVVALGGGVTGDMAGLAAATFLRGTGFVQIPTTLLAMVDSSIGGKVAVDLPQGKNLIGAFYQPDAVYTDPDLLDTLPDSEFSNGMAELVKHGFIFDETLIERLARYPGRDALKPHMEAFIAESCDLKRKVVEEDERDEGRRQLLNFGHTLGHAIEKVTGFTAIAHGAAVAIGMSVFTRMSEREGWSEPGTSESICRVLTSYGLPVTFPDISAEAVLEAMLMDKKARSGRITIVTLDRVGVGRLRTLSHEELKEALHEHLHG